MALLLTEMLTKLRRALANLGLVLASLLLCYLILEAVLRVAGYPGGPMRVICYDPIIGNVYCPSVRATIRGRHYGDRELRTNADGAVDHDYPVPKPPGTYRIALLGDSMVASIYLDPSERIDKLWAKELSTRLGRKVEVIDFGLQGTGTWEQIQIYHLRVRKYQPDLVVLAFYWGNDVWNNMAKLDGHAANPLNEDYDATRFERRFRTGQRAFARWVWNHSLAYQFLRTGVRRLKEFRRQAALFGWGKTLRELAQDVRANAKHGAPRHLEPRLGMPEYEWHSPQWELTRKLIRKLDEEVRGAGARLAVYSIPANIHVVAQLPQAEFERFLSGAGIASFGLFDLYASQDRDSFQRQFIPGDVHWTREGHAAAASHTVQSLANLIAGDGKP